MKAIWLSVLITSGFYPPINIFLVLISVSGWVDSKTTVQPEGLYQSKIQMKPSRIEPATSPFVTKCLNKLFQSRIPLPPAGRIISIKNSNDTIWNRTRDLPVGNEVPEQTLLAPHTSCALSKHRCNYILPYTRGYYSQSCILMLASKPKNSSVDSWLAVKYCYVFMRQ